jgi:hypothetical protein
VPPKLSLLVGLIALAVIGLAMVRWLNPKMRFLAGAALVLAVVIFVSSSGCPSTRHAQSRSFVAPDLNPPPPPSSQEGIKRIPAPAQ